MRANELVHIHNERNVPQAKLGIKVNARFLSNEHGNMYFLLHNYNVHMILFDFKKFKKLSQEKKKI